MAKRKQANTKFVTGIVIFILAVITVVVGNSLADKKEPEPVAPTISDDKMYIDFIDVGQGNCTLITCGETTILVDAGDKAYGETVVNYLNEKDVDDIDLLIATHPHSDHIGGLIEVANSFSIGDIIMPSVPKAIVPTNSTYRNFLTAISNNNNKIIKAQSGMTYTYGELQVEIFGPIGEYEDLNNESVVLKITYGQTSVMLMGDAETDAEKDLLSAGFDFSADIMNMGHHGSRTSSSVEMLRAVDPEYAVICCGEGNDYGHPHKQTLNKLNKLGIEYYRTDLDGDILFESDGKTVNKIS